MPIDKKTPNPRDEEQNGDVPIFVSSFFDSVEHGSVHNVELEIKYGTNVNSKDDRGRTAGHLAAYRDDYDMLELLLSCGLDLTIKDEWGAGKTVEEIITEHFPADSKMREVVDAHYESIKAREGRDSVSSAGSTDISLGKDSSGGVKELITVLRDAADSDGRKSIGEGETTVAAGGEHDSLSDRSDATVAGPNLVR